MPPVTHQQLCTLKEQHPLPTQPTELVQKAVETPCPQRLTFPITKYGSLASTNQCLWSFIEDAAAKSEKLVKLEEELQPLYHHYDDLHQTRQHCKQVLKDAVKQRQFFGVQAREQRFSLQTEMGVRYNSAKEHKVWSRRLQSIQDEIEELTRFHGRAWSERRVSARTSQMMEVRLDVSTQLSTCR